MGEGSCSAVKTNLGQRMPEIPRTSESYTNKDNGEFYLRVGNST